MATWTTPKTDWYGTTSMTGVYTGDRFDATDFNRIKNNLDFLRDQARMIRPEIETHDLGEDRTYNDFFYADEINALEENLQTIAQRSFQLDYGDAPFYYPNGPIMDFKELNRLESAILDLYNILIFGASERLRMFEWNFGIGVGL